MNLMTKYNPNVFLQNDICVFHVTCVLHDSRQSRRMEQLHIENKKHIWLSSIEEIKLTEIINTIIKEKNILVWAYNICKDHVHMILVCKEEELNKIVQTIKGASARRFNQWKLSGKGFKPLASSKRGNTQNHLWAQKFNRKQITTEKQLFNAFQYIQLNRQKHGLSKNNSLNQIIYGTC